MEILRTQRLTLSAPTDGDVPAITAACQDPAIQAWTIVPAPYERSHAEEFVKFVAAGWASGLSPTWALREDGELVGMVGLSGEEAGSAELGFWLTPHGRGRGLMDEAVTPVCAFGFERLGLARITWRAQVGNLGSAGVARRTGFYYEGLIRLGSLQRGVRHDQWVAGRLAADGELTPSSRARAMDSWPAETWPEGIPG